MNTQNYKFTFQTRDELIDAQFSGYIEAYDCVRITRTDGLYTVNHPCKSKEDFDWCIDAYGNSITEIEQTVHSYDINDYL